MLTAWLAMGITIFLQWRELAPLRTENRKLREERGSLVIENPSNLYAIKIPKELAGDGYEAFRIFVPDGKVFRAWAKVNDIPESGIPPAPELRDSGSPVTSTQKIMCARLIPGENIVRVRTKHLNKDWVVVELSIQQPGDLHALPVFSTWTRDCWPTVNPPENVIHIRNEVVERTSQADSEGKLVLLRHRVEFRPQSNVFNSFHVPEPSTPTEGMMLWVEPVEKTATVPRGA
jgi:hypothetical protein